MSDGSKQQDFGRSASGFLLVGSTLIAAVFVAVQAFYARTAFVEGTATRLLEKKLDACFENFDAAVELDTALRAAAPGAGLEENWPPRVVVSDPTQLARVQSEVVPHLNALESSLTKASILGPLDEHRMYLMQQISGLSQRLLKVIPSRIGQDSMDVEINKIFATLSDFLGSQYQVFVGCRAVAKGEV